MTDDGGWNGRCLREQIIKGEAPRQNRIIRPASAAGHKVTCDSDQEIVLKFNAKRPISTVDLASDKVANITEVRQNLRHCVMWWSTAIAWCCCRRPGDQHGENDRD